MVGISLIVGLQSESAYEVLAPLLVIHTPSCRATRLTASRGIRTNTLDNYLTLSFSTRSLVDGIDSHGPCLQAASNTLVRVRLMALITLRPEQDYLQGASLRARYVRRRRVITSKFPHLLPTEMDSSAQASLSPLAPPHLSSRHLPNTPRNASQDAYRNVCGPITTLGVRKRPS